VQFNKPRVGAHKRSGMPPTSGHDRPTLRSQGRQGFAERQNHYGRQVRPRKRINDRSPGIFHWGEDAREPGLRVVRCPKRL
jgi:hypothetical protein